MASLGALKQGSRPYVAYATDGQSLRAILPLMPKTRMGVVHFHMLTPSLPMPMDILHTDTAVLDMLVKHVHRLGRPLVLPRLLETSPAVALFKQMTADRKIYTLFEPASPMLSIPLTGFPIQDRPSNAARVSILAASYGFSGGPSDVIFQYASPSTAQISGLYHDLTRLDMADKDAPKGRSGAASRAPRDFINDYLMQTVLRGEIRFSTLRFGDKVLAAQVFQVRKKTAWLLRSGCLERFRSTMLPALLLGEAVRLLQKEHIEKLALPSDSGMTGLPKGQEIPLVTIRSYPWSSRSLSALMLGRAGNVVSRRLLRRGRQKGA
jgi:Acetyltransferase (GNAT) domain